MALSTKGTQNTDMGTGERIVIRCDLSNKRRFRAFATPFDDQEAALVDLLEKAERLEEIEAELGRQETGGEGLATAATR